jgi:hypothetical protein
MRTQTVKTDSLNTKLHLPKPIEPESLVSSIAAAMGRDFSSQ